MEDTVRSRDRLCFRRRRTDTVPTSCYADSQWRDRGMYTPPSLPDYAPCSVAEHTQQSASIRESECVSEYTMCRSLNEQKRFK